MNFDFLNRGAMLAPMAGVTDMPFRVLCHEMGCPMAVSEMVSAKGYLLAPKDNRATRELLSVDERERGAVALQLFGHEPEIMARAAEELTRDGRYALLDINMGCPVPKIVGNGEGSALMKEPVRAAEIVAAVAKASHVPVTVKMRLGFEAGSETYLLLGQLVQESGAQMITLHARTRSQFYEGRADWSAIGKLKRRVSIPVVGNGDVTCWQDALRMREETGCDGVAVGRAAQGNPWIFREILAALEDREIPARPNHRELYEMILRHAQLSCTYKGEYITVREMRKHLAWYTTGLPHAAALRRQINSMETMEELMEGMKLLLEA